MKSFVPLIGSMTDRGVAGNVAALSGKDQLFFNCLFYPVENKWTGQKTLYVERRPGMPASGTEDTDYTAITGFYHWKALGTTCRYGYNLGGGIPAYGLTPVDSTGTNTLQGTTITPIFHVSESKNSAGTTAIFYISAGNSNTYTTVYMWADGDAADTHITVPSGSCGHLAHKDGYIFVANTDGRIYNSTLNDPTTGYTDFIGVDMYPDVLVTVFQHDNYILGFGTHSVEFFRLGEQTTGSPLQRIPELFQKVGIYKDPPAGGFLGSLSGNGPPILSANNTIYWIGQTDDGFGIFTMDGNKAKQISTTEVDKRLQALYGRISYVEVGKRKLLLVPVYLTDLTFEYLCYDIDLDFWSIWDTTGFSMGTWKNTVNGQGLIAASGNDYYVWDVDDTVPYLDIASTITRTIRVGPLDMDTNSLKDFPSLSLIGDKQTSTSNVAVRWTKDDFQNWSTSKNIDMSSANPGVDALGVARRIAFEFSDTVQNPQRLRGFELEYNVRD